MMFGYLTIAICVYANDRVKKVTVARIPCEAQEAQESFARFKDENAWITKTELIASWQSEPQRIA